MKLKHTIIIALLLAPVIGCYNPAAVGSYKKDPPLPDYDASITAPGLHAEVHVYRDRYAVPQQPPVP